ncbi:MAG: helix-turn-helix domain-containing protein [Cellulomonas sp.]
MSYSFGQPDIAARLGGLPPPDGGVNARQPGAILHALQILECVAHRGPGTTASEISTDLCLSRATTYRLVRLLADDEYLVRMPDLRGFTLGRRVAELAAPAAPTPPLSRAARAVLTTLRDRVRAGVHLVHYSGGRILITDEDADIPLTNPHRLATDPGATAAGRLATAWLEAQRTGARPPTHELQVRRFSSQRGCLALPVQDVAGHLVAALLVEAPAARLDQPDRLMSILATGVAELTMLIT